MIKTKIEFEYFLKSKLAENNLTLKNLAELLHTSQPNLSKKFKRCSFDYIELSQIADILGYKIEWVKNYEVKKE